MKHLKSQTHLRANDLSQSDGSQLVENKFENREIESKLEIEKSETIFVTGEPITMDQLSILN